MSSGSLVPIFDYDFSEKSSLLLSDGHLIKLVSNEQPYKVELVGVGHEPKFDQNNWGFEDKSAKFVNPELNSINAEQRLFVEETSTNFISSTFSIHSSEWKPWSIFLVCQTQSSASYQTIFGVFQKDQQTPWPKIVFETSPTNFVYSVLNDGNHIGNISGVGGNIGTIDNNHHIIEISADGAGNLNVWFDSSQVVTNASDYRPKTCDIFSVGSGWNSNPVGWSNPFTGLIAHIMIFNQNLGSIERNIVQSYLQNKHNV